MIDLKIIIVMIAALFLVSVTLENLYKMFSSALSFSYRSSVSLGNVLL